MLLFYVLGRIYYPTGLINFRCRLNDREGVGVAAYDSPSGRSKRKKELGELLFLVLR